MTVSQNLRRQTCVTLKPEIVHKPQETPQPKFSDKDQTICAFPTAREPLWTHPQLNRHNYQEEMSCWCFKALQAKHVASITVSRQTKDKFHFASRARLYFLHPAFMKALHHTKRPYESAHDSDERYGLAYVSEWVFPLWSAVLSVLSPHTQLCQSAEKPSVSLSLI